MSGLTFAKAVKQQEKLRLALDGPSGAGKTWTALLLGTHFVAQEGGRIAVIDSERGSAKKYASDFDFDHLSLPDSSPFTYIAALNAAVEGGYSVIVVDSLSHAWEGTLEYKDEVTKRSQSKNSFDAWREVTPVHNDLVDTMLRAPAHVIVTMRTKTAYLIEEYEDGNGRSKSRPVKLGLKPIQRDGVEYEFDVVGDMDLENTLVVSKTRCSALSGAVIRKPGEPLAKTLWGWLNDGEPIIGAVEVNKIKAVLNAGGKETRQAWLDRFGCRPDELPLDKLADAQAFIAELEPPPDGGGNGSSPESVAPPVGDDGKETPGGAPPVDVTPAGEEPVPQAGSDPAERGVTDRDVFAAVKRALEPFGNAAPPRQKTKTMDRIRHALTWSVTGRRTIHLNEIDAREKSELLRQLNNITVGRLEVALDDDCVVFTPMWGDDHTPIPVEWSEIETEAAA